MARRATADAPPPNTNNIDELIRDLNRDLAPLEAEKEAINEKIRKLRQAFKGDSGMTLADFDAGRRLAMIQDEDARAEKINNLRRVYNSLAEGEQLDFIQAGSNVPRRP